MYRGFWAILSAHRWEGVHGEERLRGLNPIYNKTGDMSTTKSPTFSSLRPGFLKKAHHWTGLGWWPLSHTHTWHKRTVGRSRSLCGQTCPRLLCCQRWGALSKKGRGRVGGPAPRAARTHSGQNYPVFGFWFFFFPSYDDMLFHLNISWGDGQKGGLTARANAHLHF